MAMKPVVNRLEKEFEGKVDFKAFNIDETDQALKTQYKFRGQPQFVVVSPKGEILSLRNGIQKYESLKADIEKALATQ
jgi:hypothetical protein